MHIYYKIYVFAEVALIGPEKIGFKLKNLRNTAGGLMLAAVVGGLAACESTDNQPVTATTAISTSEVAKSNYPTPPEVFELHEDYGVILVPSTASNRSVVQDERGAAHCAPGMETVQLDLNGFVPVAGGGAISVVDWPGTSIIDVYFDGVEDRGTVVIVNNEEWAPIPTASEADFINLAPVDTARKRFDTLEVCR